MRNSIRDKAVAGQVRAVLEGGAVASLSDGELLERFASRSGASAEADFAALVARHGPMVLLGMTLNSPVDGTIATVDAEEENFYGPKDVLLQIAASKP